MTAFTHQVIDSGIPGYVWVVDGNSKITAANGTYADPAPNALSFPHISHCPGATDACMQSCYVHGLKKHAPNVYQAYELNARTLARILMVPAGFTLHAETLGRWIEENCKGGFRWHVSGDVSSLRHASFIQAVCRASPSVRHWLYTRTLDAVPILCAQPEGGNLTVNVSCDRENVAAVYELAKSHKFRMCYLYRGEAHADPFGANDLLLCGRCYREWADPRPCIPLLPEGSVIFPDYPFRGRELREPRSSPFWRTLDHEQRSQVCPADFFGQSEHHRCGPCDKCIRPVSAP